MKKKNMTNKITPHVKYIIGSLITGSVVYFDPLIGLGDYIPNLIVPSLEAMAGSYAGGMLAGVDMGNVWAKRFALASSLGALAGSQFGPMLGLDSPMGAAVGAAVGFYGTAVYPDPHPVFNMKN